MENPCLVIIDVQEKLFPVMKDRQTLLKNLIILIKGFQLFKLPVIITEQVPEKLGNTIEFRTTLEVSYQLKNSNRIGLSFGHISNANLGNKNPGVEILSLSYHIPY